MTVEKKSDGLRRLIVKKAEILEEECDRFLEVFVSDLSEDAAKRRCEMIISHLCRLIMTGHEQCRHDNVVPIFFMDADRIPQLDPVVRSQCAELKLVAHVLYSSKNGFLLAIMPQPKSEEENSLEHTLEMMTALPPRPTSIEEIFSNGITPSDIVQGVKKLLHGTLARTTATQSPAMA